MTTNLPISSSVITTEEEKQVLALFQEGKRKVSKTLLVESPSQLIVKNIDEYLILKQVRDDIMQMKIQTQNKRVKNYAKIFNGRIKN